MISLMCGMQIYNYIYVYLSQVGRLVQLAEGAEGGRALHLRLELRGGHVVEGHPAQADALAAALKLPAVIRDLRLNSDGPWKARGAPK